MSEADIEAIASQYRQALEDCERLYLSAARECLERHPTLVPQVPRGFLELMDDLHKGLAIKIYSTVAQADMKWTPQEARLGAILFEQLWHQQLTGDRLREATLHLFDQGAKLKWYGLIRPFDQIQPLHQRIDELETVVVRMANLVAKCDGAVSAGEAALLRTIQEEIAFHLRPISLADDESDEEVETAARTVQQLEARAPKAAAEHRKAKLAKQRQPDSRSPAQRLTDAMRELNDLIGLSKIKNEVSTLTNYLKLQTQRRAAGLPATDLSLHMVFTGNPGTGKTSVARIVGSILGAMGILQSGHLVETDRTGLVAEYAGQTGPKTNKRIDEAIDGVLFIDEAYSLVAESSEDAYGREALQTLLKRMEDDRQRLVVILAGYPGPMESLIHSNPGLQSRFSTRFDFEDYTPGELGRIFQSLCDKNHYQAPGATQARLLVGFRWLYERRDERFGNGRLARNVFEHAIRRLANRVAGIAPITTQLLSVIEPGDIEMDDVPTAVLNHALGEEQRFAVACPGCGGKSHVPARYLGIVVKCKTCGHQFTSAWGEPLEVKA
jgi:hypothetical protein